MVDMGLEETWSLVASLLEVEILETEGMYVHVVLLFKKGFVKEGVRVVVGRAMVAVAIMVVVLVLSSKGLKGGGRVYLMVLRGHVGICTPIIGG